MDTRTDHRQSQTQKAEGSRENLNVDSPNVDDSNLGTPNPAESGGDAGAPMERGAGQVSHPDKPLPHPGGKGERGDLPRGYPTTDRDDADGVTNRPPSEEEHNQRDLPPGSQKRG